MQCHSLCSKNGDLSRSLLLWHQIAMRRNQRFRQTPFDLGPVTSFGKSQRFRPLQKQQLKASHIELKEPQRIPVAQVHSFRKSQRFEKEKPKYEESWLEPNVAAVKRNSTQKVPIFGKGPLHDLQKSSVSISTVASESLKGVPGPGAYRPKQEIKTKNGIFLKSERFKGEKLNYEDTPLFVSDTQTKKRPPSCAIKAKVQKTKQLISRQKQEQVRERLKMVYWKTIPLQYDRLFRSSVGPVLRQEYFNISRLTGAARRCAFLMLMEQLRMLRGGLDLDISKPLQAPCAAVYRKSTPKPFKFSEMEPGPDYYFPDDDLIRPKPIGFTFGKAQQKPNKAADSRDYEINQEYFKKGGNIVINPLPREHRLTEEQARGLEIGPGYYDVLFKQVQKRTDVGVLKFPDLNQKNDRQNNCIDIKEVNDGIYFPNFNAIEASVGVPLYKQPAEVGPKNIPDKVLFPEHWLFYDGDLKKVRAQIAKNVILAKNMSFKEYQQYTNKFNRFKQYLAEQKRGAEVGLYTPEYIALDPHVPGVDMARQEEKTLIDPIIKPQGHLAGDNLILNPHPILEHLPNNQFKKMVGRDDNQKDYSEEPREGDRLLLNPTKPQKKIPRVQFEKMPGRPEGEERTEQGREGDRVIIHPKMPEKHIPSVDMQRQKQRDPVVTEKDEMQSQNVLQLEEPKKPKGVPFSRLSSVRLVPQLRSQQKGLPRRSRKNEEPQKNNE